jgi:RNA polymerase sigma-70 factor (ECF subfamily)
MMSFKPEFEKVALTELPVLYRTAKRLTRNDADAEDLVAQTLMQGAKAWEKFDGRYARSWLIRILQNEFRTKLRKLSARPEEQLDDDYQGADEGFWEEIDWKLVGEEILTELDQLPEHFRMAVALCDVEQLSHEEAAIAMEVAPATVRSRLFRGRKLLRARLVQLADSLNLGLTT